MPLAGPSQNWLAHWLLLVHGAPSACGSLHVIEPAVSHHAYAWLQRFDELHGSPIFGPSAQCSVASHA